jgi:hypothetical protein
LVTRKITSRVPSTEPCPGIKAIQIKDLLVVVGFDRIRDSRDTHNRKSDKNLVTNFELCVQEGTDILGLKSYDSDIDNYSPKIFIIINDIE